MKVEQNVSVKNKHKIMKRNKECKIEKRRETREERSTVWISYRTTV